MPETLTPGQLLKKLVAYVEERHRDQTEEISQLIDRSPDKVTGKQVFKISGKRLAYKEILDWIEDESKKVKP